MSAKRKSYSFEYKKRIVEDTWGKNLMAFCKENKLDLRMVQNGEQSTITSVNRWTGGMLRRASVDQVGSHYFLRWKTSSVNGLLTGKQRLWLCAGLILKHLPLQ